MSRTRSSGRDSETSESGSRGLDQVEELGVRHALFAAEERDSVPVACRDMAVDQPLATVERFSHWQPRPRPTVSAAQR